MSYIGNQPFNASFITDTFSGTGSQTVYNLTVGPGSGNAVLVVVSGILQSPSTYSVIGQILTFSQAPPTGSNNIVVRYLSLPASSVTNTAYRNYTELTASAGQTTFTPASYTPGFVDVFRNGVRLNIADYTASNGTTVVLNNSTNAGDTIAVVSFYVSSVLNALPNTAGSISNTNLDITAGGGSGAMIMPYGATGTRPTTPTTGMERYNTTLNTIEIYTGTAWWQLITPNASSISWSDNTSIVTAPLGGGIASQTNPFNDNTQIMYCPLNGNTLDLTGNYTFSTAGTVSYSSAGNKFGYVSPLFSSGNYFYSTANISSAVTGNGARTVCAWVKLPNRTSSNDPQSIVAWGALSASNMYAAVSHISGSYQWAIWGYSNDFNNSGVQCDFSWHFFCNTFDGSGGQGILYLDGQIISRSSGTTINTSQTVINIGTCGSSGSYYFPGYVNSVRIFNRALQPYEVHQLYLYGK